MAALGFSSCTKQQLADAYTAPNTVSTTTVEKQFAGFLASDQGYVMYQYYNYFAVLQNTLLPWSQGTTIYNNPTRFVPGAEAISARWSNFYGFVGQYKEFLNVYSKLSPADQAAKRIYVIAATIYYYDQSQKMVDLHGDLPWSEAGLLSTTGNYQASYAKYDQAATIYTTMLDSLKSFADELNTISVPSAVQSTLNSQDFINNGSVTAWKKYCNSLRVRMLMRVSGVSAFQSRVSAEISAILGNQASYPLILTNADNVQIKVYNITSGINNGTNTGDASDFYSGLKGWGNQDIPSKPMVDTMIHNADPRLRAMFDTGASAGGAYRGLDPTLDPTTQNSLATGGTLSRYSKSTLSENNYLPGMLMNAAEVNFYLAEYYLNAGNDAAAQTAYETGIGASIDYYFGLRAISNSSISGPLAPTSAAEKNAYIASNGISWTTAGSNAAKLNRIAIQKWTNYSVLQPLESWAEERRLKLPVLSFLPDNTNAQTLPPNRLLYPSDEKTFNSANYAVEAANDNLSTKIFWDVK